MMDVERFRKVLGMLGSEHEGERSAAALRATAMLKESGIDWGAVTVNQAAVEQKDAAGGDLNVLMRTLEKLEAFKSALSTEQIRVRLLEAQVNALRQQIYDAELAKAADIPPPETKRKKAWQPWRSGNDAA